MSSASISLPAGAAWLSAVLRLAVILPPLAWVNVFCFFFFFSLLLAPGGPSHNAVPVSSCTSSCSPSIPGEPVASAACVVPSGVPVKGPQPALPRLSGPHAGARSHRNVAAATETHVSILASRWLQEKPCHSMKEQQEQVMGAQRPLFPPQEGVRLTLQASRLPQGGWWMRGEDPSGQPASPACPAAAARAAALCSLSQRGLKNRARHRLGPIAPSKAFVTALFVSLGRMISLWTRAGGGCENRTRGAPL